MVVQIFFRDDPAVDFRILVWLGCYDITPIWLIFPFAKHGMAFEGSRLSRSGRSRDAI